MNVKMTIALSGIQILKEKGIRPIGSILVGGKCANTGVWGTPGDCNARKMVEYNSELKEVTVYHLGKHTCTPKFNTAYYDSVMAEALSKHFKMGPVALKTMQVNEAVANFATLFQITMTHLLRF